MFLFRVWYICVVVFALLGFPASAWDYCEENWCPLPSEHIACNNNGTLGPKCLPEANLMPLTNRLRHHIVHIVNFLRNEVAAGRFIGFGPALRMASIRWDPELAHLAELSVKRCSLSVDSCRNTRRFKNVGQLTDQVIFSAPQHGSIELIGNIIYKWFKEFKLTNAKVANGKTNSFRQLMQERATHMGCGVLRQRLREKWYQEFIVCNFAREDNAHEPPYEESPNQATGCQAGHNPHYPNLCDLDEEYDVNAVDRYHNKKPSLTIKFIVSEPKPAKEVKGTSPVPEKASE